MTLWKRENITTEQVLSVYARPHEDRYPADQVIAAETGAPIKVVWAAMVREEDAGHLDCGSNLRGGWLTDKGKQTLEELKGEDRG
jgi:hypothetical protein